MSITRLPTSEERRIAKILTDVIEDVNSGTEPNEALYKASTQHRLPAPYIERMAEAYNNSTTLSFLKKHAGQDRVKEFPLIDAKQVLSRIFPDEVYTTAQKSAATQTPPLHNITVGEDVDFTRPKSIKLSHFLGKEEKVKDYPRDLALLEKIAFKKKAHVLNDLSSNKQALQRAYNEFAEFIEKIATWFKETPEYSRDSLATVERKLISNFGEEGRRLIDLICKVGNLSEKRAKANERIGQLVFDGSREPYNFLEKALIKASEVYRAADEAEAAVGHAQRFFVNSNDATLTPYERQLKKKADERLNPIIKRSFISLLQSAKDMASEAIGDYDFEKTPPQRVRAKVLKYLEDPNTHRAIEEAKVKSMLSDFANNDEILSGYDYKEIANAYNQIASSYPKSSTQPLIMRGLLRKMLQQGGVIEPFEADQLGKIERQLRANEGLIGGGTRDRDTLYHHLSE